MRLCFAPTAELEFGLGLDRWSSLISSRETLRGRASAWTLHIAGQPLTTARPGSDALVFHAVFLRNAQRSNVRDSGMFEHMCAPPYARFAPALCSYKLSVRSPLDCSHRRQVRIALCIISFAPRPRCSV